MARVLKTAGISVLLLILLAACAPYTRDEKEFAHLVSSWQLIGMRVEDATPFLEARGFKVNRIREGNNPSKAESFPEALFATQSGGFVSCVVGNLEWRIILTINQEKIAKVRTFIFKHCL